VKRAKRPRNFSPLDLFLERLTCSFVRHVPRLFGLTRPTVAAFTNERVENMMANDLSGPVALTDAELDMVAAGQQTGLINLFDTLSHNNVQVAVPVNAAVAANILGGGAAAGAVQHPGRQTIG
jgi:hypothetical protein